MRLGIFGGTFDPPHLGHLIFADEAKYQLSLDRVLFVLTADPPHKLDQVVSPLKYRLPMLREAIEGHDGFELSRVDIDRPAPHYAIDTMKILRVQNDKHKLVYLMGSDSLMELPTWHDPIGFVNSCDAIGVFNRLDHPIELKTMEQIIPGLSKKVKIVRAPLLEISSSEIRERVQLNKPYQFYLPPKVYKIILSSKLYQSR